MEKINNLKESLKNVMIQNFERDGYLTPILFFYKDGGLVISMIPNEYLSIPDGKSKLSELIKETCALPNVFAAGIICGATGGKVRVEENQNIDDLVKSGLNINQCEEKFDMIMMIFSTPEKEDIYSYRVNVDEKTVFETEDKSFESMGGMFSNLFQWTKN